VCGSNLLLTPESTNGLSNLNFLSPDGKCYSFDERANGYSRGEGIVSLVIKPLSAAIQDGDPIRALIRGTGVNSDGRTPGITQPSSEAQIALIRKTYSSFGLDPSLTQYFEAHGTGTSLGDTLEAKAIATVFSPEQRGDRPLYVGAVKSNIGHLEGASGLASVVKSILALEKAVIPPNIWFDRVNPAIKQEWCLTFPTKETPFPGELLRRASINSFGFGGTNAHVVLDDAESYLKENALGASWNSLARDSFSDNSAYQVSKLLIWSAADESGVARLYDTYTSYFHNRVYDEGEEDKIRQIESLAYTLSQRRTHHKWRGFYVCEASKTLRNLDISKATKADFNLQICYVFTGQGAQWAAMGRELLFYDTFRQSLEDSDTILRDMGCQFSILGMCFDSLLLSKYVN
jgi:acyl transferase domain-containing protein